MLELLNDPIVGLECITLGLTACYLGRITLSHGVSAANRTFSAAISPTAGAKQLSNYKPEAAHKPEDYIQLNRVWQGPCETKTRAAQAYRQLFDVGDTISVTKRSMRWQRFRRLFSTH